MKLKIKVDAKGSKFPVRLYTWGTESGHHSYTLEHGDEVEVEGENISMHGTDGDAIPQATDQGLGGGDGGSQG